MMIELKGLYTDCKIFANEVAEGVKAQVYDIINCRAFQGQKVVCMPDVHVGASGPCGLVATIGDYVCPEHIGVDIGCSVSMMVLDKKLPRDLYAEFEHLIKEAVPFGFDIHQNAVVDMDDFLLFLTTRFFACKKHWPEMLEGLPEWVDEKWISEQLKRIGISEKTFYNSLGTVGGGNHFIEYDEQEDGNLAGVTLHFGSRHFGLKVCNYWMRQARQPLSKEEIRDITREFKEEYIQRGLDMKDFGYYLKKTLQVKKDERLAGYLTGESMKDYLCDMCFAQLYAEYNHRTVQGIITNMLMQYGIRVRKTITSVHNYIDLIDHTLRKSALRSYEGEYILVPFNMRDGIAVCYGLSNAEWLNSCAHGAGRRMSRSQAKQMLTMDEFKESMKDVYSTTVCEQTIDEAPMAYKDTDEIRGLIQDTCKIKYMMKPKINIKGYEDRGHNDR